MKYLKILIVFAASLFFFNGCYTQLVMHPSDYEGEDEQVS